MTVHTASTHCACGMVAGRIAHCEFHAAAEKYFAALNKIATLHIGDSVMMRRIAKDALSDDEKNNVSGDQT